jgi:hypothetical protein
MRIAFRRLWLSWVLCQKFSWPPPFGENLAPRHYHKELKPAKYTPDIYIWLVSFNGSCVRFIYKVIWIPPLIHKAKLGQNDRVETSNCLMLYHKIIYSQDWPIPPISRMLNRQNFGFWTFFLNTPPYLP